MEDLSSNIPLLKKLQNYGRSGLKNPIRGVEVGEVLKNYQNLIDFLPNHNLPAICEPLNNERVPLTHKRLKQFIERDFNLSSYGVPLGERVALLLPNGAELAVTVLATTSKWCAAPINPTNTWEEIKMELLSTRSIAMIIMTGVSTNEAALKAAEEVGIGVITIKPLGKQYSLK
jgi:non-ribosomal peptide synthetase component E (peptide arylation enzyme)